MPVSRRAALKTIGVAGGLTAASGTVLAKGEYKDDERTKDETTEPADDDYEAPEAAVRVAHFSPDAPNVDVYVEGDRVLADVAYGDVSPYLEIAPGTYQVTITAAGDPDTVAFDDQVTFGSAIYTVAAIGELEAGTFRPKVLVDAGSALVRAVHASPDAPAVDIYAGEDPLFENLAFGEETEYLAVPAGDYSLSIRPAGEPDAVASFDVSLEAGTAYSGYAIGYLNPPEGATGRDFTVELTVDGAMADE
ncbi:protein of unknown function [Halobiforma haloterrestris]|uniref:DUF4397 domain-containing protein n=1 Tax=Natronobacterium haloterrestre TaxID=148448 RepID=A0A1I1HY55_NATHA|nr:DUF4397 domain-containing protein [Halobiforma haloterrestris]SFC28715.1 protein of unknown function [Halobiforma haloterrestris]